MENPAAELPPRRRAISSSAAWARPPSVAVELRCLAVHLGQRRFVGVLEGLVEGGLLPLEALPPSQSGLGLRSDLTCDDVP
jgi:hypothetical protein